MIRRTAILATPALAIAQGCATTGITYTTSRTYADGQLITKTVKYTTLRIREDAPEQLASFLNATTGFLPPWAQAALPAVTAVLGIGQITGAARRRRDRKNGNGNGTTPH